MPKEIAIPIGGIISGLGNVAATAMTNRANRQLAEYAYSKDLEMWNRQNEYNSPQAQMERLQAAGLNPAMMYGQGSQAAGQAKEMPKYNAPTMDYTVAIPMIVQTLGAFQDIKVKQAQEKSILADVEYKTGSLESRIRTAIHNSHIKASEEEIKAFAAAVENALWHNLESTSGRDPVQVAQRKAQLGISQEAVGRTKADALIRNIEADLYEQLRKLGAGTSVAKLLVPIIQSLIKK